MPVILSAFRDRKEPEIKMVCALKPEACDSWIFSKTWTRELKNQNTEKAQGDFRKE